MCTGFLAGEGPGVQGPTPLQGCLHLASPSCPPTSVPSNPPSWFPPCYTPPWGVGDNCVYCIFPGLDCEFCEDRLSVPASDVHTSCMYAHGLCACAHTYWVSVRLRAMCTSTRAIMCGYVFCTCTMLLSARVLHTYSTRHVSGT